MRVSERERESESERGSESESEREREKEREREGERENEREGGVVKDGEMINSKAPACVSAVVLRNILYRNALNFH